MHVANDKNSKTDESATLIADFIMFAQRSFLLDLSKELNSGNISYAQFFLLGYLANEDFLTMTDISKKMGHSTAAATGLVDRLEKLGYVQRLHAADDRRKVMVQITRKGIELVNVLRNSMAVERCRLDGRRKQRQRWRDRNHAPLPSFRGVFSTRADIGAGQRPAPVLLPRISPALSPQASSSESSEPNTGASSAAANSRRCAVSSGDVPSSTARSHCDTSRSSARSARASTSRIACRRDCSAASIAPSVTNRSIPPSDRSSGMSPSITRRPDRFAGLGDRGVVSTAPSAPARAVRSVLADAYGRCGRGGGPGSDIRRRVPFRPGCGPGHPSSLPSVVVRITLHRLGDGGNGRKDRTSHDQGPVGTEPGTSDQAAHLTVRAPRRGRQRGTPVRRPGTRRRRTAGQTPRARGAPPCHATAASTVLR